MAGDAPFKALAAEKKISIVNHSANGYSEEEYAALADIIENYHTVYVTVNKPATTVQEELAAHDIDSSNVFFIDAVSDKGDDADNILLIESPAHLTDLSIAITEFAEAYPGEPKFLIFDAVSTLPTYTADKILERFLHHLIGRIRGWRMGAALICAPDSLDEKVEATLTQLCDAVIS